jgi:hypothetical protein
VKAKNIAQHVTKAMDQILKVIPPREPDRPNLEEIFTLLDLAERGSEILGLADIKWKVVRPCMMGLITEAFLWHGYQFENGESARRDELIAHVLEAWTGLLRGDDTIVSFNWDVLHEAALWRAHKWHFADGYGFVCGDAPPQIHSPIKLLKLHGSVNWAQGNEDDCLPSVEYKNTFFPPARDKHDNYRKGAATVNGGRNLIMPSYLKDVTANKLLLGLWNQASEAILNATEVIAVGFQLNPADALARHLLGSAVLRNSRLSKITVVSPKEGANHWAGFCRKLGKNLELYPMTFEEWVVKHAQPSSLH